MKSFYVVGLAIKAVGFYKREKKWLKNKRVLVFENLFG